MKLGVKLHSELDQNEALLCEQAASVPNDYPALCHELNDDDIIPNGFAEMTIDQFLQYKSDHYQEYLDSLDNIIEGK